MRGRIARLSRELASSASRKGQGLDFGAPKARWVRPENLHVTLHFLGDVSDVDVAALRRALPSTVEASRPFLLTFRGVGAFPSAKRPRVLWAGVDPVPDGLVDLHGRLAVALTEQGFDTADERAFKPHVTMARFNAPVRAISSVLDDHEAYEFGALTARALTIFESRLSSKGAEYSVVERIPFGGTRREQLV